MSQFVNVLQLREIPKESKFLVAVNPENIEMIGPHVLAGRSYIQFVSGANITVEGDVTYVSGLCSRRNT